MARGVIVFDMDGVLVEVGESYRQAIVETVRHFTGKEITRALIQDYKNQGGWNNDWALSQRIAADLGVGVEYDTVVREFNRIFLGDNGAEGLIARELWIARGGLLERLGESYDLAIFTGRSHLEAGITLKRFAAGLRFDPIVCAEDVVESKPAPEGLLKILKNCGGRSVWYVGDTVDDARCTKGAGVPFIGVASPGNPRHAEVVALLKAEGAVAVLEDVNQLEEALAKG